MTHQAVEHSEAAVPPDLVRLSCGVEAAEDLIADLRRTFDEQARNSTKRVISEATPHETSFEQRAAGGDPADVAVRREPSQPARCGRPVIELANALSERGLL
jgi:hypothetical protein